MSANTLPNEILQHILKNLCGSDILNCSRVCRRWEQAVNGLSDQFWKEICADEHSEIHKIAFKKAKLSWRELYVSLSLWSDVATADTRIIPLDTSSEKFQLLSCGKIACWCRRRDDSYGYDTIVYYDLETLKEDHRENYDFYFTRLEENDHFIVMEMDDDGLAAAYIQVILKSNKKKFAFGKGVCSSSWTWTLHETNIYLQCNCQFYKHLYRVQIANENNELTLVIDDIKYLGDCLYIQGITNTNQVTNIISKADGRIYSLIDKDMKLLCNIDTNNDDELNRAIKKYDFDWQSLDIFDRYTFSGSPIKMSYSYGKTVIIYDSGKFPQSIDIYYVLHDNPYDDQGEVTYDKATPTMSIDLSVLNPNNERIDFEIRQIGVVETEKGHKVVVSSLKFGIFIIELNHNATGKIYTFRTSDEFYDKLFMNILKYNLKPWW